MILNIKELDRIQVACSRHVGAYETCEESWDRLLKWADEQRLEPAGTMFLGICHDDPELEDSDEIRYDACITVPSGTVPGEGITIKTVGGGTTARSCMLAVTTVWRTPTTKFKGTGCGIQDPLHRDRQSRSI